MSVYGIYYTVQCGSTSLFQTNPCVYFLEAHALPVEDITQSVALQTILTSLPDAIYLRPGAICSVCLETFPDEAAEVVGNEALLHISWRFLGGFGLCGWCLTALAATRGGIAMRAPPASRVRGGCSVRQSLAPSSLPFVSATSDADRGGHCQCLQLMRLQIVASLLFLDLTH
eukprot:s474_g8.t1